MKNSRTFQDFSVVLAMILVTFVLWITGSCSGDILRGLCIGAAIGLAFTSIRRLATYLNKAKATVRQE